jgi:septum formation protein
MIRTSIHSEPIVYFKDVVTKVTFREMSVSEIEFYINTKEPFDKAGAYGIQGIGSLWVKRIEGSYPNVVGLPIAEVWEGIQELIKLTE